MYFSPVFSHYHSIDLNLSRFDLNHSGGYLIPLSNVRTKRCVAINPSAIKMTFGLLMTSKLILYFK